MRHITLSARHVFAVLLCFALLISCTFGEANEPIAPDLGPNVRYAEKPEVNDDPDEHWEEWNESKGHKNRFPKRQGAIEAGMHIEQIIGKTMRQEKVLYAYLKDSIVVSESIGNQIKNQYFNLMRAGGIGCNLWYVHNVGKTRRQIVLKCETLLDGHLSKDFLVTRPEIQKVVLDNLDFLPKKDTDDDDEDDDAQVKKEL